MTPWDQGPDGAGQEAIFEGIRGAEKHVIGGAGHSTIFDSTEEHARVVIDFFRRHGRGGRGARVGGRGGICIGRRRQPFRPADVSSFRAQERMRHLTHNDRERRWEGNVRLRPVRC